MRHKILAGWFVVNGEWGSMWKEEVVTYYKHMLHGSGEYHQNPQSSTLPLIKNGTRITKHECNCPYWISWYLYLSQVCLPAMITIAAVSGDFTQRCMVVPYRRFGTTYRAYLQGLSIPRGMVAFPVKMGPMGCSETSLRSHHTSLLKIPKCADLNQISK
jgi:hypothetical protein